MDIVIPGLPRSGKKSGKWFIFSGQEKEGNLVLGQGNWERT